MTQLPSAELNSSRLHGQLHEPVPALRAQRPDKLALRPLPIRKVDLVVAVTTGFLSSPSPIQKFAFDNPNTLITAFPLVMIPVFLVPLAILLHLASLTELGLTQPSADGSIGLTPIAGAVR
jgi:hypothetical protein